MDQLHTEIVEFNRENNTQNMVQLHSMGNRSVKGKVCTKWSVWREYNWVPKGGVVTNLAADADPTIPRDNRGYTDCLHLTDPMRVISYVKVLKYFSRNT